MPRGYNIHPRINSVTQLKLLRSFDKHPICMTRDRNLSYNLLLCFKCLYCFTVNDLRHCPIPLSRSHAQMTMKVIDDNKYCAAVYTCDTGYDASPFGNTATIICDADGFWPEMSFNCFSGKVYFIYFGQFNILL